MTQLFAKVVKGETELAPLYCIHSTPFDHTYLHDSYAQFLENGLHANRTIHFIDLPSHGQSEDIIIEEITFKNIAKIIDQYRIEQGHEQIILYGHGIGGLVAQVYAVKYKKHLAGLILSNTSGDPKYQKVMGWNIRDRMTKVAKQKIETYYGKTDKESLRIRFSQGLTVYFNPPNAELAESILESLTRFASDPYVKISHFEIPKHYMRENMRTIKCPALIIGGSSDVWPVEYTRLLRNDMVKAEYVELNGGHFAMIENPEKYWSEIIKFVNNVQN